MNKACSTFFNYYYCWALICIDYRPVDITNKKERTKWNCSEQIDKVVLLTCTFIALPRKWEEAREDKWSTISKVSYLNLHVIGWSFPTGNHKSTLNPFWWWKGSPSSTFNFPFRLKLYFFSTFASIEAWLLIFFADVFFCFWTSDHVLPSCVAAVSHCKYSKREKHDGRKHQTISHLIYLIFHHFGWELVCSLKRCRTVHTMKNAGNVSSVVFEHRW